MSTDDVRNQEPHDKKNTSEKGIQPASGAETDDPKTGAESAESKDTAEVGVEPAASRGSTTAEAESATSEDRQEGASGASKSQDSSDSSPDQEPSDTLMRYEEEPPPSEPTATLSSILGWIIILGITVVGGYFRFHDLDLKPLHHDEGVNGWFVLKLLDKGKYHYNPGNYHGPLLYVLHTPSVLIGGRNVFALRFMTALFGTLAVPATVFFRRHLGWFGVLVMAAFVAVAPIEIYFSRTAIHEIYNFTFNFAMIGGIAVWAMTRDRRYLTIGASALACLFATKETTIITVAAVCPALLATLAFGRNPLLDRSSFRTFKRWIEDRFGAFSVRNYQIWLICLLFPITIPILILWFVADLLKIDRRTRVVTLVAFLVTWALLFSFWFNPRGLGSFFEAFFRWGATGTDGKGHQKPWPYFFTHLLWPYYRPLLLWGGLGLIWSSIKRERLGIFTLVWLLLDLLAYSTIRYKTPWCVLSFSGPLFIGLGLFAKHSFRVIIEGHWAKKIVHVALMIVILGTGVFFGFPVAKDLRVELQPPKRTDLATNSEKAVKALGRFLIPRYDAWTINFKEYDVKGHPFIYVQNVREYLDLINDLHGLIDAAQLDGDEEKPRILMLDAKNPMRWYLKKLGTQQWRKKLDDKAKKMLPDEVDIVVSAKKFSKEVEEILGRDFMMRKYHERPGRKIHVFIRKSLWSDYLAAVKEGHAYKPSGKFSERSFSDRLTAKMRQTWIRRGRN